MSFAQQLMGTMSDYTDPDNGDITVDRELYWRLLFLKLGLWSTSQLVEKLEAILIDITCIIFDMNFLIVQV